jgi:gliding motility-associated-like protein
MLNSDMNFAFRIFLMALPCLSSLHLFAEEAQESVNRDLIFVPNQGQWEGDFLYKADLHGGHVFLEEKGLTYLFFPKSAHHGGDHTHGPRYAEVDGVKTELESYHEHETPETEPAHAYKVRFLGANTVATEPFGLLKEYHNYYYGNDQSKWKASVPLYEGVKYPAIYPGVDLVLYSEYASIKYDFVVAPGASIANIQLAYEGVNAMNITNEGHLEIVTSVNTIQEIKPFAYQWAEGEKKEVPCFYQLKGNKVHYVFPEDYDHTKELIIDPALIFSTYSGSTADNWGFTSTFDKAGNMYIGGVALGSGYPTSSGAFQTSYRGADTDVAITKLSANGSQRIFSTYLGGNRSEYPSSLIVDDQDNLIVFGVTGSSNFPISSGAFQSSYAGGGNFTPIDGISFTSGVDIYLTKFNANGTGLVGSTYYGGNGIDGVNSNNGSSTFPTLFNYGDNGRGEVNLTSDGRILIGSCTFSNNIPMTAGGAQSVKAANQDGLVACFNQNLSQLLFSTFVGGGGQDAVFSIQQDGSGNIFVCGGTSSNNMPGMAGGLNPAYLGGRTDGFIIKLNANASAFLAGTYLGTGTYDQAYLLDLDRSGNVYVVGQTLGSYPTTAGVYRNNNARQFIHKVSNDLKTTVFATTFGTAGYQYVNISPTALLVDDCENIHVVGWGGGNNYTFQASGGLTTNMPVTSDGYKRTTDGDDFYLITLKTDAVSLLYGSFFGEGGNADHIDGGTSRFDKAGIVYQGVCASCGGTNSFPTTAGVVSRNNRSSNCNMAGFKFQFDLDALQVLSLSVSSDSGCAPLSVNFNYTATKAGTSFFWDFGDGSTSTAEFPVHTFNNPGEYRVKFVIRNPNNCNPIDSAFTIIKVADREAPTALFDIDSSKKCVDGSIQFINRSIDATRYEWDFGDGTTSTSAASPITKVYPNQGTYTITLRAINSILCDTLDVLTKTVTIPPLVTADFSFSGTPCVGETFNFTNLSTNGVSYTWTFPGGSTSTQNNPSFVFNNAGSFQIKLKAENSQTCNLSDEITKDIVISEATVDISPAGPVNLCNGENVLLTATPGFSTYVWTKDGVVITGASTNTYTFDQAGNYAVEVTNNGSCNGQSNVVTVNVSNSLDIEIIPPSATICQGVETTLSITTSGLSNIIWFRDGVQINTNVSSINTAIPGKYTVTAENSSGCKGNSNEVDVIASNTINAVIAPAGPLTICQGNDTTLTLLTSGLLNIQWFKDGTLIPGQTGSSLNVTQSGNYTLTAENNDGCPATSNTTQIVVAPLPNVQITPSGPVSFCTGENAILSLNPAGLQNIQWTRDGNLIAGANGQTLTVAQAGNYAAAAVSADGCPGASNTVVVQVNTTFTISLSPSDFSLCQGESASISIQNTGLTNIQWFKDGVLIPSQSGTSLNVNAGGAYSATALGPTGCQGSSAPVNVNVSPLPVVTIVPQGPTSFCAGGSVILQADVTAATPDTYNWQFAGTSIGNSNQIAANQAGTYALSVVSTDGCPGNTATIQVTVGTIPTVNLGPDVQVCRGTPVSLNATTNGATYQWSSGETTPSISPSQSGSYAVTVNVNGCLANDTVIVQINDAPVFSFSGPIAICDGEDVVLDASPSLAEVYQWSTGESTPQITVSNSGNYSVVMTIANCSTNAAIDITLKSDPPTVSIGNDTTICEDAGFTIVPVGTNIISYLWSDGSTGNTFTVNEPGTISLTVNGECGTAEASVNIGFKECGCTVFVPNVFTPNKDGSNDVLKPLYKCPVEDIWFMVFNRWGEKVFETREIGKGWDGIYKNELQPNDAYIYYVRYFDPSIAQSFETRGSVLLIK